MLSSCASIKWLLSANLTRGQLNIGGSRFWLVKNKLSNFEVKTMFVIKSPQFFDKKANLTPPFSLPRICPFDMMTLSNGNIFRVTGPLRGEFTGKRWFPQTKASDVELWCFDLGLIKRLSKQSWGWWIGKPSRSLWRRCNAPHWTRFSKWKLCLYDVELGIRVIKIKFCY